MSLTRALIPGVVVLAIFTLRAGLSPDGHIDFTFTLFDDAMISMGYARTLVETGEWVWFPGADRVQGFTNPLWTLYFALLHLAGLEGSRAALAVGATSGALLLWCGWLAGRLVQRSLPASDSAAWSAAIAAGTIPLLYPLIFWSVRGMEVGLIALCVLLMIDALDRQRWMLAGWIGACGLATRIDFAVLAGALLLVAAWPAGDARTRIRLVLRASGPLIVTGIVVLAFQHLYWGDWLTNTYRLKMEGFSLVDRLSRGTLAMAKGAPVLVLVAWGWCLSRRSATPGSARRVRLAVAAVGASVVYAVWVGGDAWEWTGFLNRYVSVTLPAAVVVVVIGADGWLRSGRAGWSFRPLVALAAVIAAGAGAGVLTNPAMFTELGALKAMVMLSGAAVVSVGLVHWAPTGAGARIGVGVLILATTSGVGYTSWIATGGPHVRDDQAMVRRGGLLAAATQLDAVIATVWAGGPAYYARRPMIDLLGKSDRAIAGAPPVGELYPGHNKWNYHDSIRDRQPDVVFQLWREDASLLAQMNSWGYERLCLSDGTPIHVRRSSDRVDRTQLVACGNVY